MMMFDPPTLPRRSEGMSLMAEFRQCILSGLLLLPLAGGCVKRTVEITSTPSDALVCVNHVEAGRTPFSFEFTHDGTYDVRVAHEECIPLATQASTEVPVWDLPGPDVVAELIPVQMERVIEWHFELQPLVSDPQARIASAMKLRDQLEAFGLTHHTTPRVVDIPGDGLPSLFGGPKLPPSDSPSRPGVAPPPAYSPDRGGQIVNE